MNRRQALMGLSAIAGHALFPDVLDAFAASIAGASQDGWPVQLVNEPQSRILAEAVDTILPQTSTPGAKAARVHVFVDLVDRGSDTPEKLIPDDIMTFRWAAVDDPAFEVEVGTAVTHVAERLSSSGLVVKK